jgi:hypothetical protein
LRLFSFPSSSRWCLTTGLGDCGPRPGVRGNALANKTHKPYACGHKLFTTPDLYFAVCYEPQPDCPKHAKVLCENTESGKAIAAFLSPFDALLSAAYISEPGKIFHVIPGHMFGPTEHIDDHEGRLVINLHVGWAAHDGQLLLRHGGQLASYHTVQEQSVSPENRHHIEFVVERETLDDLHHFYELAGLFAYRETFTSVRTWNEQQVHRAVAKAIQTIPGTVRDVEDCNQLALYDPEGERWHFVPSTLPADHD